MSEELSGYNQLGGAEVGAFACDYNSFAALILDNSSSNLHGKVITKLVGYFNDYSGSSSGNVQAFIINGSNGSVMASSDTFNANTLSNSPGWTQKTLTFSGNSHVMSGTNMDYIQFKYNYGGAGSDLNPAISIKAINSAETNIHAASYSGSWNQYSAQYDLAMDIYQSTVSTVQQIGIARTTSSTEANANQYDALVATPTTFTNRTSNDLSLQVYINSATGTPNHLYTTLHNSTSKFAGLYINSSSAGLYNQKVTRCTFRIKKTGTPTGTLYCRLKKASDGSTITFGLNGTPGAGLDVSTLTTGSTPATLYSFENDDNGQATGYATQVGDRIYVELSGGTSSAGNQVDVARTHTTSRIANVEMQVSTAGTTWTASDASGSNDDDMIGIIYTGGYTPPPIFPYHTLGYVNSRIAQKVTSTTVSEGNIWNQRITRVRPWLKRIGSPTGTINAVIRNAADSLVANINTYDASSVSNAAFEQIQFLNLNQTYTMALNDKICIEFSGGDVNNHIQCNTNLLDTYPYGVLETFAGSSYTTQTLHDLAGDMHSGGGSTDPLARSRVGEKVVTTNSALKFKKISRITVYLKRHNSPTGNVSLRVRNAADQIVATIGTIDASTIDPNTPTAYQRTSSPISVYALQVGDHVSVEYNAGSDVDYVELMTTKTTDAFDGTVNTYLSKYDDVSWVPNSAIDLVGQLWEGGDSYTPSQEDVVIPDPKYTKDLTVLAGGSPWTWIDHDDLTIHFATAQLHVNAIMPDFRFYRKLLTTTELDNINANRTDRADISLGEVSKFAYSFISED